MWPHNSRKTQPSLQICRYLDLEEVELARRPYCRQKRLRMDEVYIANKQSEAVGKLLPFVGVSDRVISKNFVLRLMQLYLADTAALVEATRQLPNCRERIE